MALIHGRCRTEQPAAAEMDVTLFGNNTHLSCTKCKCTQLKRTFLKIYLHLQGVGWGVCKKSSQIFIPSLGQDRSSARSL